MQGANARERLADEGADIIFGAFAEYESNFVSLSRRARKRFERLDWAGHQRDSLDRLDLYENTLRVALERLSAGLGPGYSDHAVWRLLKPGFERRLGDAESPELARTFFNSLTRRIFATVGVDPGIEFATIEPIEPVGEEDPDTFIRYEPRDETSDVARRILETHRLDAPYADLEGDSIRVGWRIDDLMMRPGAPAVESFEILKPMFFRNKGAYLIGRIRTANDTIPLVIPLHQTPEGMAVDAVLTSADDVSVVFSFTRSYFHVDSDRPRALIAFLKTLMPSKPISELYISLGLYKHGKTELYRSLRRHLDGTSDRFEIASGEEGMVMLVFTLPSWDRVFKVIRDEFGFPKETTPEDVRRRYRLVFELDRVGRLVEAQQFEHLKFHRDRFAPDLLEQIRAGARKAIREEGEFLVIRHLYTERRVRPLNLYLREVGAREARLAILDYGAAIKELAAANIFPGDFLMKNFGVTRHGRVVFYDYDELCLLTDCRFRKIPQARNPEDELDPEPWFGVQENDVFPEEFRRFLGVPRELMATFERHHGELFTAEFWKEMQDQHAAGAVLDFFPYPQDRRLRP